MNIISIIIVAVVIAIFLSKRDEEHEEQIDKLNQINDKLSNINRPSDEMSDDELVDKWFSERK